MPSGNLGRGLGSLIPKKTEQGAVVASPAPKPVLSMPREGGILALPIESITPNPHQPREHFDHHDLDELVSSIKKHGLLQPVLVTTRGDGSYELIAGERRLRASKLAGLTSVPAVVRSAEEMEKLELALIENIQRKDLTPIEEAKAYRRLIEEYGLTQEDVAARVGKGRATIANMLRLLSLPIEVQQAVEAGTLPPTHARTLASLKSIEEQRKWFAEFMTRHHTVREVEHAVAKAAGRSGHRIPHDANLLALEEDLRRLYGAKVVVRNKNGAGVVEFSFFSQEEFEDLLARLRK